jgi:nanoRNase/pAp phosphatase (c-di-AMP/oligoRNAs hydrolase)
MDPNAKSQAVERIKEAQNVLVTVSSNPSVDQLAAAIGLTIFLNKLDKHATAVFSGAIPSTLEFLEPEETLEPNTDSLRDFIISLDKSKADKLRYKVEDDVVRIFITPYRTSLGEEDLNFTQGDFNVDVVVALGVQEQDQLDQAIRAHGRIFHDATIVGMWAGEGNTEIGSVNWIDSKASSLCEMLMAISESIQSGNLDEQIATAFLTGIVANTDRFKNDRTTPKVMSMSAQLMAAGANQQLIATELANPPVEIPQEGVDFNDGYDDSDQNSDYNVEDGVLSLRHDDLKKNPSKQKDHKKLKKPFRRHRDEDYRQEYIQDDYAQDEYQDSDNRQPENSIQQTAKPERRRGHQQDDYIDEPKDIWQDDSQNYGQPQYRDEAPKFQEPPAYRHKVIAPPQHQPKKNTFSQEYLNEQEPEQENESNNQQYEQQDYAEPQQDQYIEPDQNQQAQDYQEPNGGQEPFQVQVPQPPQADNQDQQPEEYIQMGGPQMVFHPSEPPRVDNQNQPDEELTLPTPTSIEDLPKIKHDRGSKEYLDQPPIAAEGNSGDDWGVQPDEGEKSSIEQGQDQNYSKFMTEPPTVSSPLNATDMPVSQEQEPDPLVSIESSGPMAPQDMPSTVPPQLATDDDAESPSPLDVPITPHELLQDDGETDINKNMPLGPDVKPTDTLSDIEQEVQEFEQAFEESPQEDALEKARQEVEAIQNSASEAQSSPLDSVAPPVDFMPLSSDPYGPPPPQPQPDALPQFDPEAFGAHDFDQDQPPEYPPPFTPFSANQSNSSQNQDN